MTWEYYSYYDLVRKDSFDCLQSLACGRFSQGSATFTFKREYTTSFGPPFKHSCSVSFWQILYFVPIAEVLPGWYIRGDMLKKVNNKNTNTFCDFGTLGNHRVITLNGGFGATLEIAEGQTSGSATYEIYANRIVWDGYHYVIEHATRISNSTSYPCVIQYDVATGNATLDFSMGSKLFSPYQSVFSEDYPNQSVTLDDLDDLELLSFSISAQRKAWSTNPDADTYFQTRTVVNIGLDNTVNPITEPLFSIPFIYPSN